MPEKKRRPPSPEKGKFIIQCGTEFETIHQSVFVVTDPDSSGTFQAAQVFKEKDGPRLGGPGTLFTVDISNLTGNVWTEEAIVNAFMRDGFMCQLGKAKVAEFVRSWIRKGQRVV